MFVIQFSYTMFGYRGTLIKINRKLASILLDIFNSWNFLNFFGKNDADVLSLFVFELIARLLGVIIVMEY